MRYTLFITSLWVAALLSAVGCEEMEQGAQAPNIIDMSSEGTSVQAGEMIGDADSESEREELADTGVIDTGGTDIGGTDIEMNTDLFDMNMGGSQPLELNKSYKRGIAYGFNSLADFEALSSGVSWWYNWSPSYNSPIAESYETLQVDWVPMTWNGNNPDQIRAFLDEHPEVRYLLTYNEPNFQDQANLTPAYAASIWPIFEEIAEEYDLELVGPALNYCGGCVVVEGAPIGSNFIIWMDMFLDEFQAQFGREPHMDYTALHWYDYGLEDQVDEMVMRYGKPLWLTEFALWRSEDWATDELERQWLLDMVSFLEAHPYVYRYAWFTGRRPDFPKINLLAEDGALTPLGEAYINAPYYDE